MAIRKAHKELQKPYVLGVTSGKGGVGKTITSVNLAVAAQRQGLDVLLIDADMGLANVDVVLGLKPRYNINDVINGVVSLPDIILDGPSGIKIIPSASGISKLANLSQLERMQLLEQIESVQESFDLILIDTGAGIHSTVLSFCNATDELLVVTTPEPHSMTDAYAMIKVMKEEHGRDHFQILVNMATSYSEAVRVFNRLKEVADRFLEVNLEFAGFVPTDSQLQKLIIQRDAAGDHSIHTIAGQSFSDIARRLTHSSLGTQRTRMFKDIWRDLVLENQYAVQDFSRAF